MAKIYVASSWKNEHQQQLVALIRSHGHQVYDFHHPDDEKEGFWWTDIDPDWKKWGLEQYTKALSHPKAERGFQKHFNAIRDADVCVLLLPCGRSAHTEAGWLKGLNKKVVVLMEQPQEPELMYKLFDRVMSTPRELLRYLDTLKIKQSPSLKFDAIILAGSTNTLIDAHNGTFIKYLKVKPCWIKKLFFIRDRTSEDAENSQEASEISNSMIRAWREKNMTIDSLLKNGTIEYRKITHVKFGHDHSEPPAFFRLLNVTLDFGNQDWGAPANEMVFILTIGEKDFNVTDN